MNAMAKLGCLAVTAGAAFCAASAAVRWMGNVHFMGYETLSFFIGGMALMVAGCAAKLYGECGKS